MLTTNIVLHRLGRSLPLLGALRSVLRPGGPLTVRGHNAASADVIILSPQVAPSRGEVAPRISEVAPPMAQVAPRIGEVAPPMAQVAPLPSSIDPPGQARSRPIQVSRFPRTRDVAPLTSLSVLRDRRGRV